MKPMINIITRDGKTEPLDMQKVINHIMDLTMNPFYGKPLKNVNPATIVGETISLIHDGVTTSQLNEQSAKIALSKYVIHEDYERLASRLCINEFIKNVKFYLRNTVELDQSANSLDESSKDLLRYCKSLHGVMHERVIEAIRANVEWIVSVCDERNSYRFSYRGFFIACESFYLLREIGTKHVVETPDWATMRCAIGIVISMEESNGPAKFTDEQCSLILRIYRAMSKKRYTHATPTLTNSGTVKPQMASCFLLFWDDSLDSILDGHKMSGTCQKYSGGIGVRWNVRSKGQTIHGTNGVSNGLVPLAKYTDQLGKYVDQGGGKRPGSISPQITVDHPDLIDVLNLRTVHDKENAKNNHKLFYAVLVSDHFMRAVHNKREWYFISPDRDGTLLNVFGDEYVERYERMVAEGRYQSSMPAEEVMEAILRVQSNSGLPYIINIDTINFLRNQPVPIYSSNLCAEVTVPANEKEIGVCNLASVNMSKYYTKKPVEYKADPLMKYIKLDQALFVNPITGTKYELNLPVLIETVRTIVRALNLTIDHGFYPLEECRYSNFLRRPIGIGIMGVADTLCKLGVIYGTPKACRIRANFEELLTFIAMHESMIMAMESGPIADHDQYRSGQGDIHPIQFAKRWPIQFAQTCDWSWMAQEVRQHGLRNSVLRCDMPTNSSSLIIGASPCFEPYESNIYKFNGYSIEFMIVNKYLRRYLPHLNLNETKFMKRFVALSGKMGDINMQYFLQDASMGGLDKIDLFKRIFRVAAFEINPREIIDMCIAVAPYVDQSQSMNLWVDHVSINTFNLYYYAWFHGLKTLVYYLKSDGTTKEKIPCANCVL